MLKQQKFNKANFAYFFSVSFICLFSLYLVTILPFFPSLSQEAPRQFTVEEIEERCLVPQVPSNPKAEIGPGSGEVSLSWQKSSGADYYNITYGPSSLNFLWGAPNVGNVDKFTVKGLTPGKPYYFIIAGVNGCGSSGALQEVAAYAGRQSTNQEEKGGYWGEAEVVEYLPPESELSSPSAEFEKEATPTAQTYSSPSPDLTATPVKETILKNLKWQMAFIAALIILALAGRNLVKKASQPLPPLPPVS